MPQSSRYPGLTIRPHPPLLMRLAHRTGRWYRFRQLMSGLGLLHGAAHFPFHASTVAAPLTEQEAWSYGRLDNYNRATTQSFAAIADRALGTFDLIDCGAHLGLFGAQVATFSQGCRRIIAIEPNPEVYPYVEGNLRAGRVTDITTIPAAVSDFTGHGRLCAPDYDPHSDQALFLAPDPAGPIAVIRLDSLGDQVGPRLAVKLDIEGQELAVLQAAADFLRSRERLVLCLELHENVLARVGQTDHGVLQAINAIRPMVWVEADHPERVLDISQPILPQTVYRGQCDVVGRDA